LHYLLRTIATAIATLLAAVLLASCGAQPLLSDVSVSAPELRPTGAGETVSISYRIGQESRVTVTLRDAQGTTAVLRDAELRQPSDEPYVLRFDGTAPLSATTSTDAPVLLRRALPGGTYQVVVDAVSMSERTSAETTLTIVGADSPIPAVDNLVVFPETISPNQDGIDDVAEITFGLPVTATLDLTIIGPDGASLPFITGEQVDAIPQRFIWNGRTVDGFLLADGPYTLVVRVQDQFGNLVEQRRQITVAGGGQPEATITYTAMAPQAIALGEVFTVTMRIRNTGDVPIRTYGPPSGYEYSTNEVFSSIDDGAYVAKPGGFWRVGVDWDANSGGGARRYPYRWAMTPRPPDQWTIPGVEDLLMPGEEATVVGRIRVEQPETQMGFYIGLIQDGVGFFQDRTGRTIIRIGF
jgi:hypothetical protein